jgi:hypothetical protein
MKDKLFSEFLTTYERQYTKIKGYKYELRLKPIDAKMMDNFIVLLDKKIGINRIGSDFIGDYVQNQLSYWLNLDTKLGVGVIPISWVFGKKAFDRWFEKSYKQNQYTSKLNLKNVNNQGIKGQNKQVLQKSLKSLKQIYTNILETEEAMKQITLNQEHGLLNCVQTTTLYNHKSQNCLMCNYTEKCKEILKENFPLINKTRGYE